MEVWGFCKPLFGLHFFKAMAVGLANLITKSELISSQPFPWNAILASTPHADSESVLRVLGASLQKMFTLAHC
jgi:hypothetical protein